MAEPTLVRIEFENLTDDDTLAIRRAAWKAEEVAKDILVEDPDGAMLLIRLAKWGKEFVARAERALAHPQDKPAKRKPTRTIRKVKHVYDASGICTVEHEPNHVCGQLRERAPRKGSSADPSVPTTQQPLPEVAS